MFRRYTCVIAFSLVGCAPLKGVTVNVTPVEPYNAMAWFDDGPTLSIHVVNHDAVEHSGTLTCVQQDRTFATNMPLTLAPHSDYSAFGQVMAKDVHAEPCTFTVTK